MVCSEDMDVLKPFEKWIISHLLQTKVNLAATSLWMPLRCKLRANTCLEFFDRLLPDFVKLCNFVLKSFVLIKWHLEDSDRISHDHFFELLVKVPGNALS